MWEIWPESDRGHRDEFGTFPAQEAMIHNDLIGIMYEMSHACSQER